MDGLKLTAPFSGDESKEHILAWQVGAAPGKVPVDPSQSFVVKPPFRSYPILHEYVARDGYLRLLVYETEPWLGAESAEHSLPVHVGALRDHVPSDWQVTDEGPLRS